MTSWLTEGKVLEMLKIASTLIIWRSSGWFIQERDGWKTSGTETSSKHWGGGWAGVRLSSAGDSPSNETLAPDSPDAPDFHLIWWNVSPLQCSRVVTGTCNHMFTGARRARTWDSQVYLQYQTPRICFSSLFYGLNSCLNDVNSCYGVS